MTRKWLVVGAAVGIAWVINWVIRNTTWFDSPPNKARRAGL